MYTTIIARNKVKTLDEIYESNYSLSILHDKLSNTLEEFVISLHEVH